MIKVWNKKNNKKVSDILNKDELERLSTIKITESMLLSEVKSTLMKYFIQKYNLTVMNDIEDITLDTDEQEILKIYKKIDSSTEKLS